MSVPALRAALTGYAVAPGLLLKQWDATQAVVFHPATNSTHLVDALASAALATLLGRDTASDASAGLQDAALGDNRLATTLGALLQAGMIQDLRD